VRLEVSGVRTNVGVQGTLISARKASDREGERDGIGMGGWWDEMCANQPAGSGLGTKESEGIPQGRAQAAR
jgi:hypothetical protein